MYIHTIHTYREEEKERKKGVVNNSVGLKDSGQRWKTCGACGVGKGKIISETQDSERALMSETGRKIIVVFGFLLSGFKP